MASLPWPIPLVSQKIMSKPTALATSMARSRLALISEPEPRLARLRMNKSLFESEFIRIRSPRSAPPVRFRVGSTHSKQTFLPGLSLWIRSINSSSRLDFPAPPVPVKPMTGTSLSEERAVSMADLNVASSALSDSVINKPTLAMSSAVTGPSREASLASPIKSTSAAIPMR